jgi:acetyl esterase/lipase
MRHVIFALADGLTLDLLMACSVFAQTTLDIWPGVAPGSEGWTQQETVTPGTPSGTVIQNVVTPTLTVYLPDPSAATGTGVIIAPGGYCVALAIDVEGHDVARWLQKRGIAAFVLKYRTLEKRQPGIPANLDMDKACGYGIADGVQALAVVRAHAASWGIAPDRVGMVGFSAGGMVAAGALLQASAPARPSFVGLVYGAPFGVMPSIPPDLPPVFMAWAQDDNVGRGAVVAFHDALAKAGQRPEAHVFSAGGHGFGMRTQGTTSDHWIDEFYWWMQSRGFTKAPGRPSPILFDHGRVHRYRPLLGSRAPSSRPAYLGHSQPNVAPVTSAYMRPSSE